MQQCCISTSSTLWTTEPRFDSQFGCCMFIWFPVQTCFRRFFSGYFGFPPTSETEHGSFLFVTLSKATVFKDAVKLLILFWKIYNITSMNKVEVEMLQSCNRAALGLVLVNACTGTSEIQAVLNKMLTLLQIFFLDTLGFLLLLNMNLVCFCSFRLRGPLELKSSACTLSKATLLLTKLKSCNKATLGQVQANYRLSQ